MKTTILIADDAPIYIDLLRTAVESMGYHAAPCEDGSHAINYLSENSDHIAAVILDLHMPQIDGISTLGHCRTNYPNLPVIIITGDEDAEYERIAREWGAVGYIKKPFEPSQIREALQTFLGRAVA